MSVIPAHNPITMAKEARSRKQPWYADKQQGLRVQYWASKYRSGCPADEVPIEIREAVTVWLLDHPKTWSCAVRKILVACVIVFCISAPAWAQTSYCDVAQPSSGIINSSATTFPGLFSACWDGKGTDGLPVVGTATWKVYIDNGLNATTITMAAQGGPSPTSGLTLFQGTMNVAQGTHTYQVTITNANGESVKSLPPFALTLGVPAVPTAPVKVTIKPGT